MIAVISFTATFSVGDAFSVFPKGKMFLKASVFGAVLVGCTVALLLREASAGDVVRCGQCDCFVDEAATNNLNCSRRNLDKVPADWAHGIDILQPESNVLVTFYNNSIRNLSGLPEIRCRKVAISFKYNKLEEIEDDAFQYITKLFYLDLSNNLLTGQSLRSEVFRGPYSEGIYETISLETLNVAHNQIHSLDRRLFEYTPNLKRLYLNNNPFEILDHVTVLAISSAANLEVLDLSHMDLESIPVDTFRGLSRLQQVDLSGNRLAAVPESLAILTASLQYLTFNNNPIEQLNDDSFLGLSNLKELEISDNNQLEEVRRSTFSPLRSLKVLHLCHNKNLRYISHNAFRNLKEGWTLEEVYLDDNDLSELPTDLLPWSKLTVLGLTGNNWLCNCDLANIVTKQGAAAKFIPNDIPTCIAPMRLSGTYITQIPLDFCPDYPQKPQKNTFSLKLKHKYVVWSVVGVAIVVLLGTCLGLLVNFAKGLIYKQHPHETIRYININTHQLI